MHYKSQQQSLELSPTKLNCIKLNEPFRDEMRDSWNRQTVRPLDERLYSSQFTEAGIRTSVCFVQLFKTSSAWTLKKHSVAIIGKVLNNISCLRKHSILNCFLFMLCLKPHLINKKFIYIEIKSTLIKCLRKIKVWLF